MRKTFIILFALFGIAFLFFSFIGVRFISVEKSVYSSNEPVVVSFSDFKLYRCTGEEPIEFFHKIDGEWKRIVHRVQMQGSACINGKLVSFPIRGDIATCSFFIQPLKQGEYVWETRIKSTVNGKQRIEVWKNSIVKEKKPVESCEGQRGPFPYFEVKTASPGEYRAKLGAAKALFKIK